MRPLYTAPSAAALSEVRPAGLADREQISNLILLESRVHRHLDWKAPLEWLGASPFMVLLEGAHITGALACPADPKGIAWLRLFACAAHLGASAAWRTMWPAARTALRGQGGATAAAIATQPWLEPVLQENGFQIANHIVLMEMNTQLARFPQTASGCVIRPMVEDDLPRVVDLDAAAFDPLWRNSLTAMRSALKQACYASVAEVPSGLVGYQLSTGGAFGTHLARLAVLPSAQGQGLGAALVGDLLAHIPSEREPRLTVNTQSDNPASHALYARLGFRRTGEQFPVYTLAIDKHEPETRPHGGSN